jgi:hypothetical protein
MRLPLRHPPPKTDPPLLRCLHLEWTADAALGLPLGPAARYVSHRGGRGRYGSALQWHLGLEPHDGEAKLDWEDRIELKMVSVWRNADGRTACDKLKVCDVNVDPWHKLSNVLWVFVDRVSRVVLGHRFTRMSGGMRTRLSESWEADLHFGDADLFVESRDRKDGGNAPAYYLAANWFRKEGLLPEAVGTRFDSKLWGELRKVGKGRDPRVSLVSPEVGSPAACPRCDGPLHFDEMSLSSRGFAAGRHGMPLGEHCALRGHLIIDPAHLPTGRACTREEQLAGVEDRVAASGVWRLAARVPEPEDHEH